MVFPSSYRFFTRFTFVLALLLIPNAASNGADDPVAAIAYDQETGAHALAIRKDAKQARKDAIASCVELGGKRPKIIALVTEKGRFAIAVGRDGKNVNHYAIVVGENNAKVAGEKAREQCKSKGVRDPQVTVHILE